MVIRHPSGGGSGGGGGGQCCRHRYISPSVSLSATTDALFTRFRNGHASHSLLPWEQERNRELFYLTRRMISCRLWKKGFSVFDILKGFSWTRWETRVSWEMEKKYEIVWTTTTSSFSMSLIVPCASRVSVVWNRNDSAVSTWDRDLLYSLAAAGLWSPLPLPPPSLDDISQTDPKSRVRMPDLTRIDLDHFSIWTGRNDVVVYTVYIQFVARFPAPRFKSLVVRFASSQPSSPSRYNWGPNYNLDREAFLIS